MTEPLPHEPPEDRGLPALVTPPPRRRGRWIVLLVVLLIAAVSGAVLSLRSRPTEPAPQARSGALPTPSPFFWETGDEPRALVPLDRIISGGPGPDGIPPIDRPRFERAADVDWLDAQEPVFAVQVGDDVRAYPIQILLWHEIVNDTVGGKPVAVTYCPLCNTAIVYERTVRGEPVTFGTSGRLYNSDLVMYDRATQSLWVQFSGQAVVGPLIGDELTVVPSHLISFAELQAAHPDAKVLSRETGFDRAYGTTPYAGYDTNDQPFLFQGDADPRLPAIARVVGVQIGDDAKAYPVSLLRERGDPVALNDRLGDQDIVVMFKRGLKSALDAERILDARDVGESAVFSRKVGARALSFTVRGGRIVDEQTGSTWDILGGATAGPLRGQRLTPIGKVDTFWFAWSVFLPKADVWHN